MLKFVRELVICADAGSKPILLTAKLVPGEPCTQVSGRGRFLAFAPHPDDPDASAITVKRFLEKGWQIFYVVLTSSPEGAEDRYLNLLGKTHPGKNKMLKTMVREAEQMRSANLAGVPLENVKILRLDEGRKENFVVNQKNLELLLNLLIEINPDCIMLPWGNDTNATHRNTFRTVEKIAPQFCSRNKKELLAIYNDDPKTIELSPQLITPFDEAESIYKRNLLRLHDTQMSRNLLTRGYGLDDRILKMNATAWKQEKKNYGPSAALKKYKYAERFRFQLFEPKA